MSEPENPLSWNWLSDQMQQVPWSPAARDAGAWAIETLKESMGPDWPAAWQKGAPPPEIGASFWSLAGFTGTLSLALCFSTLSSHKGLGKVRRTMRGTSRPDQLASPRLQLKVASLARMIGFEVELEASLGLERSPIDLLIGRAETSIGVEALAVVRDAKTTSADAWLAQLTPQLHLITQKYGVDLSLKIEQSLDEADTPKWIELLERHAAGVRMGLTLPPLEVEGASVDATPSKTAGSIKTEFPTVDFGTRLKSKLEAKGQQTAASGATWLLVESLDHLWHLTAWSAQTLAQKADALAGLAFEAIRDSDHVQGVVLSDGAAIMRHEQSEESVEIGDAVVGLRRVPDQWHARESIIVPASDKSRHEADVWREILDAETHWLDVAMSEVGLAVPPELDRRKS